MLSLALVATLLATLTPSILAADCESIPGVINGECVSFFNSENCGFGPNDSELLGQFKPDCSGHCFQFDSFKSVDVAGDGVFGTDCIIYADDNCQQQIQDTGNQVSPLGLTACETVIGTLNGGRARSLKCFYRC